MGRHHLIAGDYPDGPNDVAVSAATARQLALSGSRLRLQRYSGEVTARPQPLVLTVTALVDSTAAGEAYTPDTTVAALLAQDGFTRLDLRAPACGPRESCENRDPHQNDPQPDPPVGRRRHDGQQVADGGSRSVMTGREARPLQ